MNLLPTLLMMGGVLLMLVPYMNGAFPAIETLVGVSRALRKTYHEAPLETPPQDLNDLLASAEDALRRDSERRANLTVVGGKA